MSSGSAGVSPVYRDEIREFRKQQFGSPIKQPDMFCGERERKRKEMRSYTMKKVLVLALLLSVAGLAQASLKVPTIPDDGRVPELPLPLCDRVQVDETNQLA